MYPIYYLMEEASRLYQNCLYAAAAVAGQCDSTQRHAESLKVSLAKHQTQGGGGGGAVRS